MESRYQSLFSAATLANVEEAGGAVLVLCDGLEKEEFLRSRLTRAEVTRLLLLLADGLNQLPAAVHEAMPELGWDNWAAITRQLARPGEACDEAIWFAVQSLLPATLMWLRTYRHHQPELFAFAVS